eukprot:m.212637 g.212637  ORF g.212637 m.212637 type:complete len:67 (-) comp19048_c0_seq4:491-691(-)
MRFQLELIITLPDLLHTRTPCHTCNKDSIGSVLADIDVWDICNLARWHRRGWGSTLTVGAAWLWWW